MTLARRYPQEIETLCCTILEKLTEKINDNNWEIHVQELEFIKDFLTTNTQNIQLELDLKILSFCKQALLNRLNYEIDNHHEINSPSFQLFCPICDIFILVFEKLCTFYPEEDLDGEETLKECELNTLIIWERVKILDEQKIPTNIQNYLYFFKSLLELCQKISILSMSEMLETLTFEIINRGEPTSIVFILIHIFPLLRNNPTICQKTWTHVSQLFEKDENLEAIEKHSSAIIILCCLCDYHFSTSSECQSKDITEKCNFKLHHEVLFWQALHLGFLSKNATTRKRAMYIMKRVIELCIQDRESFAVKCPETAKHFMFYWDANLTEAMIKLWNDFVIMLEVLEEKQGHVIKPILHKLDNWLQHSEETKTTSHDFLTHPNWLWIICQRLLNHENNFSTRWVINWLLDKNFELEDTFFHDSLICFTSFYLLPALNDTSRYFHDEENKGCLKIGEQLVTFMDKLFGTSETNVQLFRQFINQLSQIAWGSVPLFYVVNALCSLPAEKQLIGINCLKPLKELLTKILRCQEPLLRGAIQCKILNMTFHLLISKEITYAELSHLLATFKQCESFKRGTASWRDTVLWLQNHFLKSSSNINDMLTVNRALEFCKNEVEHLYQNDIPEEKDLESNTPLIVDKLECNRLARMIVVIGDATYASNFCWRDIFIETTDILITAHSRAYMSGWKFDKAIQFLSSILQEGKPYNTSEGLKKSVICQAIIRLIDGSTEDILGYLALKVINSKYSEELNLYINTITLLLKQEELYSSISTFTSRVHHIIRPILLNKLSIPYTFCAWRCLSLCCSLAPDCPQELKVNINGLISSILQTDSIHELISKPKQLCKSPVEKQLATIALNSAWTCIHWFLSNQKVDAKLALHLAHLSLESLETGSHDVLIPVLKSLKDLLITIKSKTVVLDCLKMSWQTCMEVKKNELFRPALKTFISASYDPILMAQHPEYLQSKAREFHTIGEGVSGIFNMLVEHCIRMWMEGELIHQEIYPYLQIIQDAVIFGSIHRKDQRAVTDLSKYIASLEDKISTNVLVKSDHLSDPETRCLGMAFILHLSKSNTEHVLIASHIAKELIVKDRDITAERKRHFGNSYIHRVKNRAWQAILLLEHLLLEEEKCAILDVIYDTLAEESQQPSVRYLQEWFVIKCLHAHPNLLPEFIKAMSKSALKRVGCVASFLAIIVQLTKGLKKTDEAKLREFTSLTLPWCLGQHFTTRIYAHVAFSKIWGKAEELKLEAFTKEFRNIHDALIVCHENGNVSRNVSQMLQDFYFKVFNPESDFCLETIFYILPKLTRLSCDEWIEPDLIAKSMVKLKLTQNIIPIFSQNKELKTLDPGAWVTKSNASNFEPSNDESESGTNFQKKITPWKQMVPDFDHENNIVTGLSGQRRRNSEGLIVVASLIDKAPNLGGLCRTCEVFGVSEYVIGNLRFTEDRQFQNLSVTAEKWIPIKEVKPHQLKSYLLEMKQKGYVLIGVEQTADSKVLTNYNIPKKSVLLLGNEKEGLPVELIHLLDECVEIPQQGVIRSLNVHVSGAILIWEYARQHITS